MQARACRGNYMLMCSSVSLAAIFGDTRYSASFMAFLFTLILNALTIMMNVDIIILVLVRLRREMSLIFLPNAFYVSCTTTNYQ